MSAVVTMSADQLLPSHQAEQACPKCSSPLHFRSSKHGPFLGCSNYPACDYAKPLVEHDNNFEEQIIEGSSCPECEHSLAVKSGRYGMFIGCTNYPQCSFHQSANPAQTELNIACPQCNDGQLNKRSNKYGKSFYSCSHYPKCKYALNDKPVQQSCAKCGWTVLIEKRRGSKTKLLCANKKCGEEQPSSPQQ